jgi:hypothetical protein
MIIEADPEKCLPWQSSCRKIENAVFGFLRFPSLGVIENGGTHLCRTATSIFGGAIESRFGIEDMPVTIVLRATS